MEAQSCFVGHSGSQIAQPACTNCHGCCRLANLPHAPEKVAHLANIISRRAKHMTGLVDDLLDMSRVARGLLTIQHEAVSLLDIVKSAVEQVQPIIDSRGQNFRQVLPPREVLVMGDHKRLIQIVCFRTMRGSPP